MRARLLRRALTWCGAVAVGSAALAGCASDDGATDSGTVAAARPSSSVAHPVSAPAAASGEPADAATTRAVTDAYTTFFDGANPPDRKVTVVQSGEGFRPILEVQAADPKARGTSATVSAVRSTDSEHAEVTYRPLLDGTAMLPDQTGQAVREGGRWKVAVSTLCGLLAIQGGSSPAC